MIFKWLKSKLNTNTEPGGDVKSFMKQSLEASVSRACTNCGAKGVNEYNKDVGPKCPECGADRPKVENLGVIWERNITSVEELKRVQLESVKQENRKRGYIK